MMDYIEKDWRRYISESKMEAEKREKHGQLAYVGARGIQRHYPDEDNAFDMALAVIHALEDDNVIFARMGMMSESDEEEPILDE